MNNQHILGEVLDHALVCNRGKTEGSTVVSYIRQIHIGLILLLALA